MKIENILEEIGLTKNEIKIYLALIDLGLTTTGPLIKKTGIHTSKVYGALERLSNKGLISYIIQSNIKHFKAIDPERIIDFLQNKKRKIEEQEKVIKEILPELKLKQKLSGIDSEAEIFKGWKGMETVYKMLRNTLKKGGINYVFGASKGEDEEKTKRFFNRHTKLIFEKGIKQKIIFNEAARGNIEENYKEKKLSFVKHMKETTPAEINIWADKVMIVILRKTPIVVLISDQKVADSFYLYFEMMWRLAKK